MSFSKQKPTYYNSKGIQGQLLNSIISNHDLCCGCDTPGNHLFYLLTDTIQPSKFTPEELQKIKKCLGCGEPLITTTGPADDDGLLEGDLDALFADDADTAG